MDTQIIKDISLLFVGAFATFIFTFIFWKIQNKIPIVTWRKLSNINIPANNKTGVNWLIENIGTKSGLDVTISIKLEGNSTFSTFDVVPSEMALVYIKSIKENNNEAEIKIPIFPQNVSIDVSSLVENFSDKVIISIVGQDIVGKEHKSNEKAETLKKYSNIIGFCILILYLVSIILAFGSIGILINNKINYEQTKSIANLYLESGKNDEAAKLYLDLSENSLINIGQSSLLFEISKIFAKSKDKKNLIKYTNELLNYANEESIDHYIYLLESDDMFKAYMNDKDFVDVLSQFKKKEK